jgi:hypothetical protein
MLDLKRVFKDLLDFEWLSGGFGFLGFSGCLFQKRKEEVD